MYKVDLGFEALSTVFIFSIVFELALVKLPPQTGTPGMFHFQRRSHIAAHRVSEPQLLTVVLS